MRASRALAVAVTACAAIGLSAPLAAAAPFGGDPHGGGIGGDGNVPTHVTISPNPVHQGGTLAVSVQGCRRGGAVWSNAFPKTALSLNSSGHSAATPRIYDHARPGQYTLSVRCNDSNNGNNNGNNNGGFGGDGGNNQIVTRTFRVIEGRGAQGGLGGSMAPSSTEMAIGAGLVGTAAIGGGLFISRRRRLIGGNV
ncbi:hypothetical protein NX801_30345 [Streptomyces sp. LP05-1]|uniref:Integral membrane protein n=1 Tax=Streptomyces pyxinae TaxID=2970734 RepID=A0ABT2CTF9_9ACTN|nr:hypothetical protein [Streptomyces sp. LP05-1]MCS0639859.1 hypothetical protein [Streptomyces sp. LP05-1]